MDLEFNFKVNAYNYDDDSSIYEKNKFCGNSAIDFLVMNKNNIFFIEVKSATYFNVSSDVLSEKICKIYKNFIDSIALVCLSDNSTLKPYKVRLKNTIPKFILIISDKLPADISIVYYEKIKKQLLKKLKSANQSIEFFLETENRFNDKLYNMRRID